MGEWLYKCRAKLTLREFDGLRETYHWMVSSKSIVLHVKEDSLVWEDESIFFTDIREVSLREKRSFVLKRCLLNVKTDFGEYCFEMKPSQFWKYQIPFQVN